MFLKQQLLETEIYTHPTHIYLYFHIYTITEAIRHYPT